jgi:hypothetical protein
MVIFITVPETWSFGPGQSEMALPVKIVAVLEYWNIGVLECWKKLRP